VEPRQEKILTCIIREYIRRMAPVGSELLFRRYHLGVSPATVRNELFALTQSGYLEQPHRSAGRVPTNRGWRFFVDDVVLKEEWQPQPIKVGQNLGDLAEELAEKSKTLSILISGSGKVFLSGLANLFSQPDFETRDQFERLAQTVERLQTEVEEIFEGLLPQAPNILIGRENPYVANDDLSSLFVSLDQDERKGLALMVGPKRMPYERNWQILRSLESLAGDTALR